MKLRINGIVEDSIVDGPGLRLAVFVQGCHRHCPGCHNPQTWDPFAGYEMDVEEIIDIAKANKLLRGITITGGEPFEQARACAALAERAHDEGLDVWVFTGCDFDRMLWMGRNGAIKLLREADVIVDGVFKEELKSYDLKWRGSSNQRVIDVRKTLNREPVLWEE